MDTKDEQAVGLIIDYDKEDHNLLQGFYLSRMRGFLSLSREPALSDWEQALVRRAIYSIYLDCLSAGLAEEARSLLKGLESQPTRALVVRS
ncbi:MAG: hypothetical protein Q8R28_12555 [Dehalococcoidia bacterium]|nr:hypothetical protein [Dehalococcoidia bacterium]